MAQERPDLYDGYLIAQPAISVSQLGLAGLYAQEVMKAELGINAADKPAAAAFARKVAAATARAVAQCDREKLGFLLAPEACSYDPLRDAAMLCAGEPGLSVNGQPADPAACMTAREAIALNKIWYGPSTDGSHDPAQAAEGRSGRQLGPRQLWWGLTRGANLGGQITNAGAETLALAMQDVRYAGDSLVNTSTPARKRWQELGYASYADAFARTRSLPVLAEYTTDRADLSRLQALGRKMILWNGLAEDVIPPQGALHWYHRVMAGVGGQAQVQGFLRLYNIPGMAHSSQGRAWTVAGNNNAVPMPAFPGKANPTPTPAQDTMFSALVDWVERGKAPGSLIIRSRDNAVSYPICVYPQRTTWDGQGPATQAASYSCR